MPHAIRLPVVLLGWIAGIHLAGQLLRDYDLELLSNFRWSWLDIGVRIVATLLGFFILYRMLLYGTRIAASSSEEPAQGSLLIQKLLAAIVLGLAAITVLTQLGIEIGPMLASLGIAGLAVALALQDTLGNYFAGLIIAFDKPFRPGDYVRLSNGQEGFVQSIGWRTTHIRPFGETVVIVPNSKLTSDIIVNSYYPDLAVRVYIDCGVSYESDLAEVERKCIEIANRVAAETEGGDATFTPIVRFKEFGDSNINFTVIIRTTNFGDSFLLKHEFIKALHRGFGEAGIVINYPVRQIRTEAKANQGDN